MCRVYTLLYIHVSHCRYWVVLYMYLMKRVSIRLCLTDGGDSVRFVWLVQSVPKDQGEEARFAQDGGRHT